MSDVADLLSIIDRESFIELGARERAFALLDVGSGRELCGPFDGLESPWLVVQGVVPEADDGVVIVKGTIDGGAVVVIAIEQRFQGGGVGEVSGTKIATALTLAAEDTRAGTPTAAVLALETGGVRLQEANLGLAAVAEICDSLLALRALMPVVGVIAGRLGSFGGMSIAAGLCSALVMTRQARLGLNGPEVIESEAGIEEFDAADRADVWAVSGGVQRVRCGLADTLVEDDVEAVRAATARELRQGVERVPRSRQLELLAARIAAIDPQNPPPAAELAQDTGRVSRGRTWFEHLASSTERSEVASVLAGGTSLASGPATLLVVVDDPGNPFPRARGGEVGLREGLELARRITAIVEAEAEVAVAQKRAIVAIVDVPSQAYGRVEELVGLHWVAAAAVDAYARARIAGHPVIALIVGTALSGGFLAHGMQANQVLALDDPGVEVHAMHKPAAARITQRTVAELDELAARVAPLSYDLHDWATLGICDRLIAVGDAEQPGDGDLAVVRAALEDAVERARGERRDLGRRLESPGAVRTRAASRQIRDMLRAQWNAPVDSSHTTC